MYKILLIILLVVFLNCKHRDYCLYEVYQGGRIINRVCDICIGSYANYGGTYYKNTQSYEGCEVYNQKNK